MKENTVCKFQQLTHALKRVNILHLSSVQDMTFFDKLISSPFIEIMQSKSLTLCYFFCRWKT